MREIVIFNPAAGKGKRPSLPEDVYITSHPDDCRIYVKQECQKDPDVHFTVYGGDGTINEAVSGIMAASCGHKSVLTAVANGSGNDTVKTLPSEKDVHMTLDIIKHNDKYCINMLNMGFDCNVVATHGKIKKKLKIAGKLSYILGLIVEFFKPFGENFTIKATTVDGEEFSYSGQTLLCCICNGQWCGGSFHNSPASDMTDGVLELLIVKKTSRLNFLKLVGKYQNGTLINAETGDVAFPKYKDIVTYLKVKNVSVSGMKQYCADGEITAGTNIDVTVLPHSLNYLT